LAYADLIRYLVDSSQPRRALAVHSVDGGFDGDSGVQGCHAGGACASSSSEDVANGDVVNEDRVEVGLGVRSAQYMGKDNFGLGVLESTFPALCTPCLNKLYSYECPKLPTLVMAERTADTTTTSSSCFWRTAAFADETDWVDAILQLLYC
jgi:hypothetical protein